MSIKTSTHLTDRTLAVVDERMKPRGKSNTNLSGTINRIADRYGEIMRRTRVEDRFTPAELDALRAVANGWFAEPAATIAGGLALEFEDSMEDGCPDGVDPSELLAKLRALTYAEDVALVDSIERYWRRVGRME